MAKEINKGHRMEETLRIYFLKSGYYVARGVPFRYKDFDITDIDLWLYNRTSPVSREISIVDVKNKKTPLAIERIFWTKGLQIAIKANSALVATTDKRKDVEFNNVSITVSPDLILRWEEDGKKYIGGVKFHISKSNIFDYEKASFAAGLIHLYLKESIACNDEIVVDDYCLCVDVFGSKICSTPKNKKDFNSKLYKACDEIKSLWEVA